MIILTILKVILIIILVILGLLFLALTIPVSIHLSYIDGKLNYKIKYIISILSSDKEKKSKPKKKKKAKKTKKTQQSENTENPDKNSPEENPKKNTDTKIKTEKNESSESKSNKSKKEKSKSKFEDLPELWNKITEVWAIATKPLKKIMKGIHFDDIYINFKISDGDAYDCALKYGKTCILVYNLLGISDKIFSLKKKSIDVNCIFNEENCIYDMSVIIRFRPLTLAVSGLAFLLTYYFKISKPKKKQEEKINGRKKTNTYK